MENASKALLMAAGVLIGLLVLSLMVYLFASFASTSAEMHQENKKIQIDQFNSQFVTYEGKESVNIYDIVTVANLATENNQYYEYNKRNAKIIPDQATDSYISVYFRNTNLSEYTGKTIEQGFNIPANTITQYYNNLIKKDLENMQVKPDENGNPYQALTEYTCKVSLSKNTRQSMLSRIFKKISKNS